MARYGGSCRTKNLLVLPTRRRELASFAWKLVRGRLPTVNRRPFAPHGSSRLPREFIRLDPWEAEYLFLVAARARRGIVEIGRFHGGSTFLLACANPEIPIWSIDLAPQDDERLRTLFAQESVGDNVRLLIGDSQHGLFSGIGPYDLLFIDGDHSYEGCTADLESHFSSLAPGGHVLLHDSYDDGALDVQQAVIDFCDRHEVETLRSPYNIASHWHTSAGSIAHLRKPRATESEGTPAAPVAPRRAAGRPAPRPAPRRPRTRVAAAVVAAAFILGVFGGLPELLGDWPYNPFGKNSRAVHAHAHDRGTADAGRPAPPV